MHTVSTNQIADVFHLTRTDITTWFELTELRATFCIGSVSLSGASEICDAMMCSRNFHDCQ